MPLLPFLATTLLSVAAATGLAVAAWAWMRRGAAASAPARAATASAEPAAGPTVQAPVAVKAVTVEAVTVEARTYVPPAARPETPATTSFCWDYPAAEPTAEEAPEPSAARDGAWR